MRSTTLTASAVTFGLASAFPSLLESRQDSDPFPYQRPGPDDARSPCPGINTLANHGWIPRNGRNVTRQNLIDGFLGGWGMNESTISGALGNAFTVCEYVTGADCANTLPNITVLAEPHTFEHDHSLSRQDYRMAWANGAQDDNYNFNETIFDTSLAVLGDSTHMDYAAAQEVRLQRESLALAGDWPTWFDESRPLMLVEIGFIYGVMTDFNLPDDVTNPQVRVDWWKYWFHNESFPTPLGWHKPNPPREGSFVVSVSSEVLAAPATSTPSPLPSDALGPAGLPSALPSQPTVPILPLPTYAPYAATDLIAKRQLASEPVATSTAVPAAGSAAAAGAARSSIAAKVEAALGPVPTFLNPYFDPISPEQFRRKQAFLGRREASVSAALVSASLATPASTASA